LQNDGKNNRNVAFRMEKRFLKLRKASLVICDIKVSVKNGDRLYTIDMHLVILYGSECWVLKGQGKK